MSLPILQLVGLIQKIETRATTSGSSVTSVSLSCGEKNKNGEYDNLYIKADFWNKQSEFVSKYFHEGELMIVSGKLVTTNYTNQDGKKIYETKFMFPNASFVPKAKDTVAAQPQMVQQNMSNTSAPTYQHPQQQQVQQPVQVVYEQMPQQAQQQMPQHTPRPPRPCRLQTI